ncbi:TPA: hypothetical protein ACH3X1_005377 [Trebouxia sp. C0004]
MKLPPTKLKEETSRDSPAGATGTQRADGGLPWQRTTEEQMTRALVRVTEEFKVNVGRRPDNLMLLSKRLRKGFWGRPARNFMEDICPILKGYFVWMSHVVQEEEVELLKGHPAARSEGLSDVWTPPPICWTGRQSGHRNLTS